MEYLGCKDVILSEIINAVEGGKRHLRVLDAFSGTASVAGRLRQRGHAVHANDHLALCATWASTSLLVPRVPMFDGLQSTRRGRADRYDEAIDQLNALEPMQGFIARHYSPVSAAVDGTERRYFTVENAMRIDAVRNQIQAWQPDLTAAEHALLLSTLVAAVMDVSNTAGTYGCYLKHWKPKAQQPLMLRSLPLHAGETTGHTVTCDDAAIVAAEADVDVMYADPPYTKRQYAAYYHVLETVVRNDEPHLVGSTGLRPWKSHASEWCYKRRAPGALDALVAKSSAPRVVLSYSEDGHIPHELLVALLSAHGCVSFQEIRQRRYRSSELPHKGSDVVERIYVLERG